MVGEMTLHAAVVDVAEDYFGPAAPRLVDRLIVNHLGKTPEKLTSKDLEELASWIKLTIATISDEAEVVEEFSARLTGLSAKHRGKLKK